MSDPITTVATKRDRPARIDLPNGKKWLERRSSWAHEKFGVDDKTARRWDLPTLYVGNVAYIEEPTSSEIVAARVKRKNQPRSRAKGR
jgi:hypothetical protein